MTRTKPPQIRKIEHDFVTLSDDLRSHGGQDFEEMQDKDIEYQYLQSSPFAKQYHVHVMLDNDCTIRYLLKDNRLLEQSYDPKGNRTEIELSDIDSMSEFCRAVETLILDYLKCDTVAEFSDWTHVEDIVRIEQ